MTSRFFSICSHLTMTEVSSPPEYASTTFSFSAMMVSLSSWVNYVFITKPRRRGALGMVWQ